MCVCVMCMMSVCDVCSSGQFGGLYDNAVKLRPIPMILSKCILCLFIDH